MPCYEVNLISIDLSVSDPLLLVEAIKSLGFDEARLNERRQTINFRFGEIDLKKGKLNIEERREQIGNEIKKAYSMKAIQKVAEKKKWLLKRVGNKIVAKKF